MSHFSIREEVMIISNEVMDQIYGLIQDNPNFSGFFFTFFNKTIHFLYLL